ncbi:MAG: nucleoside-diphosphate sugar epimerase/dehydratase [Planctomycetota bacterium]
MSTVFLVIGFRIGSALWFDQRHVPCRYFSFPDLIKLVQAVTLGSVCVTLVDALALSNVTIPRSILLLDWGVTLLLLAAVNSLPRLLHSISWNPFTQSSEEPTRALIVGANDSGEGLVRAIQRSPNLSYRPVGFVDDEVQNQSRRIAGIPVLGTLSDVASLASKYSVEEVLITSGELPGRQVRELVELATDQEFCVRVLPSYEQLLREDVAIRPREVAITDLLRRPPVQLNTAEIRQWIRGRIVMVTGSCGSIGSEIASQLLPLDPAKVILVDRSETGQFFLDRDLSPVSPGVDREVVIADLTDRDRLHAVFQRHRPDIIFHAAAYKHVPLMEAHPGEAVKNIVLATRNIVDLAEEYEAESLVMISTDKAVNPTSVMGSCKRVAEQYVQAKAVSSNCRLETVRFGNVLDSAGSVVPIFRQQIASGGPVTVTHPDMIRYFMLIPEAAQLVIQAGAMGKGGEIFVLDMGEPVKLMNLARDMIRLSGLRAGEDIDIKVTGLRPGEKLYEELYSANEEHKPTAHNKIMVAASTPQNLLQVISDINRLVGAANGPEERIRSMLCEIVPQCQPERLRPESVRSRAA